MIGEYVEIVIQSYNESIKLQETVTVSECTVLHFTKTTVWVRMQREQPPGEPYRLGDGVNAWRENRSLSPESLARIQQHLREKGLVLL